MLHPPLDNWNHTTLPALCKLFFFFFYKYCFIRKLYFQNSSSVTRHIQRSPGENKEGELIGLSQMLKDLQISELSVSLTKKSHSPRPPPSLPAIIETR